VGCALLVPHQNVPNATSGLCPVEFVIDGENCSTGVTKDVFDPVPPQTVNEGIPAGNPITIDRYTLLELHG
jgi:hypothetical protein